MSLVNAELEKYINEIQPLRQGELGKLQSYAYEVGLPIIPNDVVRLMAFLLEMQKPKAILEIGMAVGFSSIFMSGYLADGGYIKTIDRYPMMIEKAKANFEKFGVSDKIEILIGDANDVLKTLEGGFDFIFMDAAKGQYINFLPECIRLLNKGGIIVCDDILQNGTVALDEKSLPRRQRTIHKRLNTFLKEITGREDLTSSILTIGDGVALIKKIKE